MPRIRQYYFYVFADYFNRLLAAFFLFETRQWRKDICFIQVGRQASVLCEASRVFDAQTDGQRLAFNFDFFNGE